MSAMVIAGFASSFRDTEAFWTSKWLLSFVKSLLTTTGLRGNELLQICPDLSM